MDKDKYLGMFERERDSQIRRVAQAIDASHPQYKHLRDLRLDKEEDSQSEKQILSLKLAEIAKRIRDSRSW